MEFRWIVIIALWTFLSGPIFGGHAVPGGPARGRQASTGRAHPAPPAERAAQGSHP
jgi:hypothetical protein